MLLSMRTVLRKCEKLSHSPGSLENTFPEVFHITFFAFNIKWTKLSLYHLTGIDRGIKNLCVAYLVKQLNHLISSNPT